MNVSEWVGLIGGIVGLIGGGVSVAAYVRDTGRLQVKVTPNMRVINPGADQIVREAIAALAGAQPSADLYYRDPDKTWTEIEIVNVGRRPVKVTAVAFVTLGKPPFLLLGDWKPRMLNEGEVASINADQADLPIVRAALARRAAGRPVYGGFRKSIFGAKDRMFAALRIAPFK